MKFFDFFKNNVTQQQNKSTPGSTKAQTNSFGERLDKLTKEGELPWGWHTYAEAFTSKIEREYTHFLNLWLDSRNRSPKELYSALKSFVLYLQDVEKLCKSKGECFEFWYYNVLTTPDYLEQRKAELNDLTANYDLLQEIYEKRQILKPRVINLLIQNDGILQSEFKKLFEEPLQDDVSKILYELHKNNEIERTKTGKSYTLHYKG